ncbi:MAG: hypothetical protein LBC56_00285 [Oscillospiraceae bacterium]|jgi:hypothetical protein|nr:hypothetical protein [Oscillospiraceae bacterium]
MGIFKKKGIAERIKPKWAVQKCTFGKLLAVLKNDDSLEIWVRLNDLYFQVGSSSDYDNSAGKFFDKVYYINMSTEISLSSLLNNRIENSGFYCCKDFEALAELKIFGGRSLCEIWTQAEIVALDEGNPANYTCFTD